jgi:hypothetical protein
MNSQVIETIKETKRVSAREHGDIRHYLNKITNVVVREHCIRFDTFKIYKSRGYDLHKITVIPTATIPVFIIDDSPQLDWLEAEAYILNLL